MKAGRLRWLAELKSDGKPIPCGRKKGGRNAPLKEREHAAYVRECERKYRDVVRRSRAERKERRAQRRQEREETRGRLEEHARRKARMDAGFRIGLTRNGRNFDDPGHCRPTNAQKLNGG